MTLVLAVLILVVAINCCYLAWLIADVAAQTKRTGSEPGNVLGIGVFSFFQFLLSTFGISDFALGAAVYSRLKWVSAKKLPGTVNTAAAIPVAVMAIVYITSIRVDLLTLVVPIVAQVVGAHVSARFVVNMPVRPIRVFLAVGMVVTVLRIAAEGFGFFPAGGEVTGLGAGKLVLLGCLCLVYGTLNNTGVGSYAPTIATVSALGLNPEVAFTIMMGAATFSVPVASIQFIRHDSYSRKIAVISSVGGTLGVLAAAFALKGMDITPLKWLIALILLYSAASMLLAALRDTEDAVAASKPATPEKTEDRLSVVGRLTSFSLALVLVCAVSLVVIFVRNVHLLSSGYVEASIREHNTRLRDGVHAYLHAHESVLLSAQAGAAHFMSGKTAELDQLRAYLEKSSGILEDTLILYCTTNEVWNRPGGYAVFSQPWLPPRDWNNTQRPWFTAAKKAEGKIAYSRPYIDARTGGILLDLSINVYDAAGNDIGVISESITIEALNAMLRKTALEGQRTFLIDGDGVFVVHPDREITAQENFFAETGLDDYRGAILSGDHFSATNNGMAVYASPIPATGWIVVSILPTENIFSAVNEHVTGMFLAPMLIIIFMLLAVFISLLIRIYHESHDKLAAEQLTRAKDAFITRMSHEIRTPMNAVIGMSTLAERDYGKPGALDYITGIKHAGISLLAIINDILDFSRMASGRLELAAAPYSTASMLRDVLTLTRVQMAEKPLELDLETAPGIPGRLIGDMTRLKQVLLNLLSNAVKYSDQGGIRLAVAGEKLAENTVRLTFVVEDNGIGIRPEDMPKLFGDFARLDEKRNSAIEGTGLGLSIARNLCRNMGGDITATSVYGQGSVFAATLIQDVADWSPMGDVSVMEAAGAGRQPCSFTAPEAEVLVADDFRNNLAVTEGLLRPYAMRVTTCQNGREAVELASARPFDLVLMDHMMPEMDGMEALSAIRALGGACTDLPVVALTAHAVSGMKERFLAGGFDDFLSKPVDAAALDAVLRRWIPAAKQYAPPPNTLPGTSTDTLMDSPGKNALAPPSPVSDMAGVDISGANRAELAAQRLDLLTHFRWHFENGLTADEAYYEKFCALIDAMIDAMDVPPPMREAAAELVFAGRSRDADAIRRLLPEFCAAAARGESCGEDGPDCAGGMAAEQLDPALVTLAAALDKGDGRSVDDAMRVLREMEHLDASARELYFFLNDAHLMGETERASARLAEWMRERREKHD